MFNYYLGKMRNTKLIISIIVILIGIVISWVTLNTVSDFFIVGVVTTLLGVHGVADYIIKRKVGDK